MISRRAILGSALSPQHARRADAVVAAEVPDDSGEA